MQSQIQGQFRAIFSLCQYRRKVKYSRAFQDLLFQKSFLKIDAADKRNGEHHDHRVEPHIR